LTIPKEHIWSEIMSMEFEYPGLFATYADMKYEQNRLNTFLRANWSEDRANPYELAKAGFLLRSNNIVCCVCNVTFLDWNPGNVPMDVHKQKAPSCTFVRGIADNVPVSEQPAAREPEALRNADVSTTLRNAYVAEESTNDHIQVSLRNEHIPKDMDFSLTSYAPHHFDRPCYFASIIQFLDSFCLFSDEIKS
jgi:hypothetical protein